MYQGQQLISRNQRFRAVMQYDGNFVLYGAEMPLWASGTVGRGFRVIMQRDGNLVLYEQSLSGDGKTKIPQWASDTQSRGDYLMCQDDGNMAVFSWNRKLVWSSNTTQSDFFAPNSFSVYLSYPN